MKSTCVLILTVLVSYCCSQEINISTFQELYSISGAEYLDDSLYITGSETSNTNGWLCKVNSDGNPISSISFEDVTIEKIISIGNKIYVTGFDYSGGLAWNLFFTQLNTDLDTVVSKWYKDGINNWYRTNELAITPDYDVLLVGEQYMTGSNPISAGLVCIIDTNGTMVQSRGFSSHNPTELYSTYVKPNGEFITVGQNGNDTALVMMHQTDTDTIWTKSYTYANGCVFKGVVPAGSNFLVVGHSTLLSENRLLLCMLDANGFELWTKEYQLSGEGVPSFSNASINRLGSSNYVVIPFGWNIGVLKVTDTGIVQWGKTIYSGQLGGDVPMEIEMYDNRIVIFGSGGSDSQTIFLDTLGTVSCNDNDITSSLVVNTISLTPVPSGIMSYPGPTAISAPPPVVMNTTVTRNMICYVGIEENDLKELTIYPNPTTGSITIELPAQSKEIIVTNLLGKIVSEFQVTNARSQVDIDLTGEPPGVYFVTVVTDTGKYIVKVAVE